MNKDIITEYRYYDEIREGSYVPGILKRAWYAQMEILKEIDRICQENKLKWFADWGTLLGAVRHKGFIPWDDDIDICMLRDDYEKFLQIARKEAEQNAYFILRTLYDEEPRYEVFARVINAKEYHMDQEFLNKFCGFGFTAGVDIFPIDYVSNNPKHEEARMKVLNVLSGMVYTCENEIDYDYDIILEEVELITHTPINRSLPRKQQIYIAFDQMSKLFTRSDGDMCAEIIYYAKSEMKPVCVSAFEETIVTTFENSYINVPKGYDEWLTSEYGNYMEVVKGKAAHGFPFFIGIENEVIEKKTDYKWRYRFNPNHLKVDEERTENSWSNRVSKFVRLVSNAHSLIVNCIVENKYEDIQSLFVSCQSAAINMGNEIEQRYHNNKDVINQLELYCENAYCAYEALQSGDSDSLFLAIGNMEKNINKFGSLSEIMISNSKEVVFMPYDSRYWFRMEKEWREALDKGYHVYVIPVPYYDVDGAGNLGKLKCSEEGYPEEVRITKYNEYDFENRHPDIIFIQNPYDECNHTNTVDPYFYSTNIRKYTDMLIYKPYFVMDKIDKNDGVQHTIMQFYCAMPGVVKSDLVIVTDEETRIGYIDYLTEMSGEEYRDIWEKKIQVE